jgi:hypothetical protein
MVAERLDYTENNTVEKLVWYWKGGQSTLNLGEHFVELLLPKMGIQPIPFDIAVQNGSISKYNSCGLVIGSELHRQQISRLTQHVKSVWVFGQGNGRGAQNVVKSLTNIHPVMLRGRVTKQQLGIEYDIPLCDPGFLMPHYYQFDKHVSSEILFVPHCGPNRNVGELNAEKLGATYMNVMVRQADILSTLKRIVSAKFVLTNSLHCLISCLAYKVPCAVLLLDNETLNMPDKWLDVFSTLNTDFVTVKSLEEGQRWWQEHGRHIEPPQDIGRAYEISKFLAHIV